MFLHIVYVYMLHLHTFIYPVYFETHLIGRSMPSAHERDVGAIDGESQDDLMWGHLNIVPHSSEGMDKAMSTGTPSEGNELAQNVQFDDAHGGYQDDRGSGVDPLREQIIDPDAPLEHFFKRPLKVAEYNWQVGNVVSQVFNPWTLYFENVRVINRISNYKLMKANLRVKFVINGNGFYFGRSLAMYQPLHLLDNTTLLRTGNFDDLVEGSQRPHVWLNPTLSQGGEMVLPFFTPLNVLDIPQQDWRTMGQIGIESPIALKHANDASTPVSISIFVWCDNISLTGLTAANPGDVTLAPQGMEEQGIISKPASNIAKVAGVLKQIPYISAFATATEIGARSIAKMAALFGYSKPVCENIPPVQLMSRQSMANCDGRENLVKLTIDPCNELTIDPRVGTVDMPDEMVVSSIVSRESLLTKFDWNIGVTAETLLFNAVVDPCVVRQSSTTPAETHMTALAFGTFPFEYWKGSLRYRFQIAASQFHKGRLKIVYDPYGTPPGGASEYNVAYTEIVDISETSDFCIDIGWGQSTPFRQHLPMVQVPGSTFSGYTGAVPPSIMALNSANTLAVGNGTISVYVVNELTSPNSIANNDISVLVFVSACEDFEVAAPTDFYLSQIGFTGSSNLPLAPQAMEEEMLEDTPVTDPTSIRHMGSKCPTDLLVNKIHMGETALSFRQLLHRYNLLEIMYPPTTEQFTVLPRFVRTMFPANPGYTTATPGNSNIISDLSLGTAGNVGNYVYSNMTLMHYLTRAYGGWRGSIRYTTDVTYNELSNETVTNQGPSAESTWCVSRVCSNIVPFASSRNSDRVVNMGTSPLIPEDKALLLRGLVNSAGKSGLSRWNTKVNPIQSYEIPYYSKFRFAPARRGTFWTGTDIYQDSFELTCLTTTGSTPYYVMQHVASGEDFTLFFYLSPPIFYFQNMPEYN